MVVVGVEVLTYVVCFVVFVFCFRLFVFVCCLFSFVVRFLPLVDQQAMARVHRIGQTNKVHVYRFVTGDSVEERIVERAQKKMYMDQMVNQTGEESSFELDKMSTKEMLQLLKGGLSAVFGGSAGGGAGGSAGGSGEKTTSVREQSLKGVVYRKGKCYLSVVVVPLALLTFWLNTLGTHWQTKKPTLRTKY